MPFPEGAVPPLSKTEIVPVFATARSGTPSPSKPAASTEDGATARSPSPFPSKSAVQLKLLKRQGYGRAGFELLRARVLAA